MITYAAISNIYFDTEKFWCHSECSCQTTPWKIRMPDLLWKSSSRASPVFLEVKSKDEEGIGHKFDRSPLRKPLSAVTDGKVDHQIQDQNLQCKKIQRLRISIMVIGWNHGCSLLRSSQERNPFRVIISTKDSRDNRSKLVFETRLLAWWEERTSTRGWLRDHGN